MWRKVCGGWLHMEEGDVLPESQWPSAVFPYVQAVKNYVE